MKRNHLLAGALALTLLAGCTGKVVPVVSTPPEEEAYSRDTFAMDTLMSFTAYGPQGETAVETAAKEVVRLDGLLSVTGESSEVWALNHAQGEPVKMGEDAIALLTAAQSLGQATGGALDVTMYPLVKAWGFTTGSYQIPDEDTISALLENTGYDRIAIDGDTVTLPQGMEVDFGALAKGYAGEKCVKLLREQGVTSAILRLSGNIQTIGAKPDGSPWRIAIRDPESADSSGYLGVLELVDQAAVTSGNYERYFEADGVRYCHIMDPATGAPTQNSLTSVTIVGDSGTTCDGLSTALFVMGRDRALDYWRSAGGFEAILVEKDKNVWITPGLADRFNLKEGLGYTLNILEE